MLYVYCTIAGHFIWRSSPVCLSRWEWLIQTPNLYPFFTPFHSFVWGKVEKKIFFVIGATGHTRWDMQCLLYADSKTKLDILNSTSRRQSSLVTDFWSFCNYFDRLNFVSWSASGCLTGGPGCIQLAYSLTQPPYRSTFYSSMQGSRLKESLHAANRFWDEYIHI